MRNLFYIFPRIHFAKSTDFNTFNELDTEVNLIWMHLHKVKATARVKHKCTGESDVPHPEVAPTPDQSLQQRSIFQPTHRQTHFPLKGSGDASAGAVSHQLGELRYDTHT